MDRRRIVLVVAVLVAAIGIGLVFVYAQGADKRASKDVATTQVLVATQMIQAGETASDAYNSGKIALSSVPSTAVLADTTADGTALTDKVALTTIYPGEQLITDKFGDSTQVETKPILTPPPGDGIITVTLGDVQKGSSFLQPGAHVALFYSTPTTAGATSTAGQVAGPSALACMLAPDIQVLSVGSSLVGGTTGVDAQGNPIAAAPTTTLAIAVDLKQIAVIGGAFNSAAASTLFFVLKNDATKLKGTIPGCPKIVGG